MKHIFPIFFMFITTLAFSQTTVIGHATAEVVEPIFLTIKADTNLIKKPITVITTNIFLKSETVVKEILINKETLIKKETIITLINYD